MKTDKILFLGAGNMAESIISGLINSNSFLKHRITATDIRKERLSYLSKKYGISISPKNIGSYDILVIAVKPQQMPDLLAGLSGKITKKQTVVSVAAGISTSFIEKFLGKVPVIRTMPNTPVFVREGMAALCAGKYASKNNSNRAATLFSCAGKTIVLSEKHFDTVTSISGSGPAYLFYFAESMIKAAEKMGLDKTTAKTLVIQTLFGASKMLRSSGEAPELLRQRVTSPGGTTEQAIKYFEAKKLKTIVLEAVKCAKKRSKELTK
ncbi:MAG: pyrroline-5-carboxylate reductase [Elusimicrobia bacterium]|nr:pyrroline-5-carboxylate reductase [Elusimicrobiota bacterium]MBU2614803.1 pyrroline-5-carboxylate reductase [Elusimicrobiota bacterium]